MALTVDGLPMMFKQVIVLLWDGAICSHSNPCQHAVKVQIWLSCMPRL